MISVGHLKGHVCLTIKRYCNALMDGRLVTTLNDWGFLVHVSPSGLCFLVNVCQSGLQRDSSQIKLYFKKTSALCFVPTCTTYTYFPL